MSGDCKEGIEYIIKETIDLNQDIGRGLETLQHEAGLDRGMTLSQ